MIEVKHPNGYRGILFGKTSMTIFYNDEEVLHTSSRTPKTAEELYKELDNMDEFLEIISDHNRKCL